MGELKNIKIEYENIKYENIRLSNEVSNLKSKIDDIEQQNLGISVDIVGIPITTSENCISIVENIGMKTNTAIKVLEAYRVNHFGLKQSKIVAKLEAHDMRKNLIRNVKTTKLTADILSNNWPKENNIFINESVTKLKRTLFAQTRLAAKEKGYKFAWLSNADILVRKNEKF